MSYPQACAFYSLTRSQPPDSLDFLTMIPVAFTPSEVAVGAQTRVTDWATCLRLRVPNSPWVAHRNPLSTGFHFQGATERPHTSEYFGRKKSFSKRYLGGSCVFGGSMSFMMLLLVVTKLQSYCPSLHAASVDRVQVLLLAPAQDL